MPYSRFPHAASLVSGRRAVRSAALALALAAGLVPALPVPAALAAEQAQPSAAATLKVGDPAPAIKVGTWLKGTPVELKKGSVTIVEFWATWCGPCKATIPHLTDLAHKYKDQGLQVVGVSIWEEDQSAAKPFVEKMGAKMDYAVATDAVPAGGDGREGVMASTWMAAAGLEGIPSAFVIDREGRVAFIGHPLELDAVLPKILAGNYDVKAEAAKKDRVEKAEAAAQKALTGRQWDEALAALDTLRELRPEDASRFGVLRFNVLLVGKKDLDAAYALAARLTTTDLKDDAEALNQLSWTILDRPGLARRDLDVALAMAERAVEISKGEESAILDTLARAHFDKGHVDEAITWQTKAVEKAASDDERQPLQATLKKYQAAKK